MLVQINCDTGVALKTK